MYFLHNQPSRELPWGLFMEIYDLHAMEDSGWGWISGMVGRRRRSIPGRGCVGAVGGCGCDVDAVFRVGNRICGLSVRKVSKSVLAGVCRMVPRIFSGMAFAIVPISCHTEAANGERNSV